MKTNAAPNSKTTIYFSPSVQKALKRRVIEGNQTMSDYVDKAVAYAIAEDLEDIEAIEARKGGSVESFDSFMKALKVDGVI